MRYFLLYITSLLSLLIGCQFVNGQTTGNVKNGIGEYKIGGNLYVQYPTAGLQGVSPEWLIINNGVEVPVFNESFEDNRKYRNTTRIRLTEINGKPVLMHDNLFAVAYIEIPDRKIVLSPVPQTFNLKNFTEFQNVNNPSLGSDPFKSGTITLSADENGTIRVSFTVETRSFQNKPYLKRILDNYNDPISLTSASIAKKKNDAQYISILEELIQVHYDGWNFDKMYKANSMRDIRKEEPDSQGRPTKITATYSDANEGNYGFTVLFNEGTPYAIFYDETNAVLSKKTCIMPYKKVNGQFQAYSEPEKLKIQNLQRKYLLVMWNAQFQKTPKEANQLKYLVPDFTFVISTHPVEIQDKETISDKNGNPIGEISGSKTVNSSSYHKVPGIRNSYYDNLIVKDYDFTQTENTISLIDYTFWMQPRQILEEFKVNPTVNNIDGINPKIKLQTPQSTVKPTKTTIAKQKP